jgi:hypothetical protein
MDKMRIISGQRHKYLTITIVLSVFLNFCPALIPAALGSNVTLAWDPNSEPTVAGYKVVYGLSSRNYAYTVDVGISTSLSISGLQPGTTYYFAALAYDTIGQQSGYSNEVSYLPPVAPSCSFVLSPITKSFSSSGGTGSVSVSTSAGCSWSASSSAAWITITSAASGSGNATVNYSVSSNSNYSTRAGNINIGSQTFTVSQSAASTATYTITASAGSNGSILPSGAVLVNGGTSKTFTITPKSGYKVYRVLLNGKSIGAVKSYTFSNIIANQTIRAEFTSTWSWFR